MTDQQQDRHFSDVRTARAHANGESYTVTLDRFADDYAPALDNVWWIDKPGDGFLPKTMHATGVLLTRYQITKDSDPTWRGEIELGAPATGGQHLRVVSVSLVADDLSSTALPIVQIRDACMRVGAVLGLFQDVVGERSGLSFRTFQIGAPMRGSDGALFHPDQIDALTGQPPRRQRGYRTNDETLRAVWDAVCEYRNLKASRRAAGIGKPEWTQSDWVAERCGLPVSNVSKQIAAARKRFGTTQNTRGNK